MDKQIFTPTAIYQFNGSQMNQLIEQIVSKIQVVPSSKAFAEMTTRQVRQHLTEKGYRVKGDATLPAVLARNGIKPITKGREHWYRTEEIMKIPPKTRLRN